MARIDGSVNRPPHRAFDDEGGESQLIVR